MNYWTQSKDNIYVAAHRGFSEKYPENTMLAFRKAIALGVDQVETDVRVSRDGKLVLIHDKTVDRTTDGTGLVCEKTLAELQSLDAGGKKGFPGERIPLLEDLLEEVKDHPTLTLDIELKEYPDDVPQEEAYDVCDRTIAMIEAFGYGERVVFNTFSGLLHEYIEDKYGDKYKRHVYYPISHLRKGLTRDPYKTAYCCCMFRAFYDRLNMASAEEFAHMEALGIQPWAGACVKTDEDVDEAIARGAYLITCNDPALVLESLRKRGKHK